MSTRILYAVAEAMRDSAAELAGRNASINRSHGYAEFAEAQESIAQRIGKVDVGALVDKVLSSPAPSADEIATFEAEAKRLYINDFRRRDDGAYSYGLTQRFWEMWRAGQRYNNQNGATHE